MAAIPRVFVASIATETNTFSPLRTDLTDFKNSFYAEPYNHPETPTLCSAVFPVCRKLQAQGVIELVEGTATWAEPGGMVNQDTWEYLRDKVLQELKAAGPIDIVLLGLHGAMVSQECNDCEGELLQAVRSIVGPKVVVGATLDPHSHLAQICLDNANLLKAFKEFPHTDFAECAQALSRLALEAYHGSCQPVLSLFDCRMIDVMPTSQEPMRSYVDRLKSLEQEPGILSISLIHGFMAGDVPEMGAKVLVITDNDPQLGAKLSRQLGLELFALRGTTSPDFVDLQTAIDRAKESGSYPAIIADVWDNPGGGVAGDSTLLLRALLDQGVDDLAFASIWDPMAVRLCFSAGVGGRLALRFGGKTDAYSGAPIAAQVSVVRSVRNAMQSFGDSKVPLGDCAVIRVDGIEVILNTVRSQVFNPDIFTNLGIDPMSKKILVVKSTNHFHDAFAPIAGRIIYASIDGPYPNNPATNDYKHLNRDIWPRVASPHEASTSS